MADDPNTHNTAQQHEHMQIIYGKTGGMHIKVRKVTKAHISGQTSLLGDPVDFSNEQGYTK